MEEAKRIADYFVIAGVPPHPRKFDESLPPVADPITDIAVIIRSNSEPVPKGFVCIEETPTGHKADLNHGSIRSPSVFLCIKRGRDKPPLVDVGVFYDDGKERVIPQCRVIYETPSGFPANVNNSGTKTFLTYRRLEENAPANQLVVTDICVILSNKNETPPHAFMLIEKNLNKGMFGSDVYLCYKKSMDRPPFIAFNPVIVDRFPLTDYASFSLSEHLPNFCLPMGASVECWPSSAARPPSAPSTFILTSNSGDKIYASLLNFYETLSGPEELTRDELKALGYIDADYPDDQEVAVNERKSLHQIKSICILSHWPFFDQFKRFLVFLYKTFCSSYLPSNIPSSPSSPSSASSGSLESYIFHFMRDIPFPSPERPNILVNLCNVKGSSRRVCSGEQETTLLFTQTFDDLPIPSNGASFRRMLFNLGPENCLHALLFALTEQKILLHSLRPSVLTEVAEAITTIIFPLNWHCPYIPMCPMSMAQYLHAPLPFIFGIDSRYFDYFVPPSDVASIDIDTKAIYLSESKRFLNMKMLPRKETKALRGSLDAVYEKFRTSYDTTRIVDMNARRKLERQIETEIQEAFLYFMASILRDFRHYLKPITTAPPRVGATDPSSLFDMTGFVASREPATQPFYEALTRTQMFTKFIEERSLVSDKNVSLAFFDECIEKVEKYERALRGKANSGSTGSAIAPLALIDFDDMNCKVNKTVFITIPDSVPSTPTASKSPEKEEVVKNQNFKATDFGPFDHQRFYKLMSEHTSSRNSFQQQDNGSLGGGSGNGDDNLDSTACLNGNGLLQPNSSSSELATYIFARRAKHEIRKAQKMAVQAKHQSPVQWAKHLLVNAYSIWFTHFPAFSHLLLQKSSTSSTVKPLSVAYQVLQRMQSLSISSPDEFCYRILMILCGLHSQPALAVKVFLDMQRHQVRLNAITYGYYNKAVLEGNWPEEGGLLHRAQVRWAKLRNTTKIVFHLRKGHMKGEKENDRIKRNLFPLSSSPLLSNEGGQEDNGDGQSPSPSHHKLLENGTSPPLTPIQKNGPVTTTQESKDFEVKRTENGDAVGDTSLSSVKSTSTLETSSSSSSSSSTSTTSSSSSSSASKSTVSSSDEKKETPLPEEESFSSRLFATPLKEALNNISSDLFSPKSRFGLGLRSSFRIAKSFTKPAKYNLPRSSTFHNEEKSNGSVKNSTPTKSTPPRAGLPRSSTLPQSFASAESASTPANGGSGLLGHSNDSRTLGSIPALGEALPSFASPWTNKSYSALKNYANLLTSSPVKLNMVSAMANSSNYLISQFRNFAFDEDEVNGDETVDESMLNGAGVEDETDDNFELLDRYSELFTKLAEHYSTAVDVGGGKLEEEGSEIVFRLQMMSCTICRLCSSVVYDEEIMCQWGAEDSNLNTTCIHCHATFVPSLTIYPQDFRSGEPRRLETISVPYLSPLVLRKELETILNSEGYSSLIRCQFLDDHPIVYWNLLWYFTRLNLPSHIAAMVLTAASINSANNLPLEETTLKYDQRNISIVCLWDSESLYSEQNSCSTPLHWRLLKLKNEKLTTTENSSSSPSDSEIIPQLVEYIRKRKVITPIQYLISERSTEKTKVTPGSGPRRFNSIYRELLFMGQLELAEQIGSATFDKDYHEAFESLTSKEKESLDALDRPPSIGAIFCRMLFKQLSLLA